MPYEISTEVVFSAAHYIAGYEGDCANLHGHNWTVRAALRAGKNRPTGMTYDFRKLKALMAEVISPLDHTVLNDLPFFADKNPTAETIAEWIYCEISGRIKDDAVGLARVEVWESASNCATYSED
ncbi:MAG: 6-carboxytetrahydropterin synthase QueD [Candidatus Eisenbacteria bacterium]